MPRSVLIIDDEEDVRAVAALCLETVAGWEVAMASSGAQGVARAESLQPEAILLDVMMPGMDGRATFAALQKNPRTAAIPVVLLTAKTESSERQQLAAMGVAGVLSKPFDPLKLPGEIAAVLGWSS
jgi:CheY-like chemotaxis protein